MTDLASRTREAAALADDEPPDDLADAVRQEFVSLQSETSTARGYAINGEWSIGCEGIATRIVVLSRFIGPTPWDELPCSLLEDGVYQALYTAAGIAFEPPDMERVREVLARTRS